jgi:hypothetical protein
MDDAADGRPLNPALLSWMAMHAFEGEPDAGKDPRVDLLGWSRDQPTTMPPTLVITDERDVLRGQGQQFARNLDAAGVATTHREYAGATHGFLGPAAVLEEAEYAQQEAAQHFMRAFGAARATVGAAPSGGCPGDDDDGAAPRGRRGRRELEAVHQFFGATSTGVPVSHGGRLFVCCPKWGDDVGFTVAELRDGQEVTYPPQELNDKSRPAASGRVRCLDTAPWVSPRCSMHCATQ